jgi:hypothetical protein
LCDPAGNHNMSRCNNTQSQCGMDALNHDAFS